MVVVGTSAGGNQALEELVMQLSKNLDAAYCSPLSFPERHRQVSIFVAEDATKLDGRLAEHDVSISRWAVCIPPPACFSACLGTSIKPGIAQ